ncbi:hypothetical protein GGR55DRAFT_637281 [Xylaria sp. FL0064]|nr:hypothetical protein GGR55DRAFT_637281 [Xylaria sp. FL0064]
MYQAERERQQEPRLDTIRLAVHPPHRPVLEKIENFLRSRLTIASSVRRNRSDKTEQATFTLKYKACNLDVDEKLVIRIPKHPIYKLGKITLYAHFFQVEFMPGDPDVKEWGDIAKELRQNVLSQLDLRDAAVEFTCLGSYGATVSTFYPPEIGKSTLMAWAAGDRPDKSSSDNGERRLGRELVPVSRLPVIDRHQRRALVPTLNLKDEEDLDSKHSDAGSSDILDAGRFR